MHELIASPFLDSHLVVRPGDPRGLKIAAQRYEELRQATAGHVVPSWLADAARRCWGLDVADRLVKIKPRRATATRPTGRLWRV